MAAACRQRSSLQVGARGLAAWPYGARKDGSWHGVTAVKKERIRVWLGLIRVSEILYKED